MNVNEYMNLFLEESQEHLQNLNDGLLRLEQDSKDVEAINEVFRSAHTLKGMSATMGFEQVAELTHKMENLLDKLRGNELKFSQSISDLLFKCVDALETMVKNISSDNTEELNIVDLLENLTNYQKIQDYFESQEQETDKNELDLNDYENNLILKAQKQDFNAYKVTVEITPGCVMKSVRAFMVFKNLEEIGEIIKSIPSAQELEDEKFDKEFTVFLLTKDNKKVIKVALERISEINLKEVELISVAGNNNELFKKKDVKEPTNGFKNNTKSKIHQTVRVDIGKLDNLMNLVGELVINKTRLEQILRTNDVSALNETIEQINRITSDLQNVVMNVRMVPIEQVFNRFPRMVRDLSKELGKEVNLIMEGKETELDRTVIDEIGDPLVHLLRNAIDHGIGIPDERKEKGKSTIGTISLIARQEGNSVVIIVQDDGQGINLQKIKDKALAKGFVNSKELEQMDQNSIINLIFSPGFSTANTITDVSGRGVGLDVVKSKIQSLSGNVFVESKYGEGTKFTIKLPLTLAIIQALLVKVGEEIYAVPLANIDETTSINDKYVKKVQGQEVMVLRGKVLPLMKLAKILEVPCSTEDKNEEFYIVVIRKGEQQVGLVVNELIGQQEIVITSLGKLLTGIQGIAGAAILGDGRVSLILDVGTLF